MRQADGRVVRAALALLLVASAVTTAVLLPASIIRIGMTGAVGNLFPLTSAWHPTEFASAAVHRGLLGVDDRGELIPMLATRVPSFENGGLEVLKSSARDMPRVVVSFVLRDDLRWSDGAPLTTDDVLFSFSLFSLASFRGSETLRAIESVEIHDQRRLSFRFRPGYLRATLMGLFVEPLYPRHVLDGLPLDEIEASPFARTPIGAGPFRVVRWRYVGEPPAYEVEGIEAWQAAGLAPAVQLITMERNPFFFGTPPSVDRLEIHVIPDAAAELVASRAT